MIASHLLQAPKDLFHSTHRGYQAGFSVRNRKRMLELLQTKDKETWLFTA